MTASMQRVSNRHTLSVMHASNFHPPPTRHTHTAHSQTTQSYNQMVLLILITSKQRKDTGSHGTNEPEETTADYAVL